jgi:hypothetical protein
VLCTVSGAFARHGSGSHTLGAFVRLILLLVVLFVVESQAVTHVRFAVVVSQLCIVGLSGVVRYGWARVVWSVRRGTAWWLYWAVWLLVRGVVAQAIVLAPNRPSQSIRHNGGATSRFTVSRHENLRFCECLGSPEHAACTSV